MGRIPLFDRWFGRIANAATFWQFAPPGFFALIGGYLAWFSHFSALVWFASGVVTFVVTAFGFGVIARTKLWRLDAKHRERVGGDSSAFDPMAKVHQNKRLFLRDLAPLGRQIVSDKKFINCEIIGPGNVIAAVRSKDTLPFPRLRITGLTTLTAFRSFLTSRQTMPFTFLIAILTGASSTLLIFYFTIDWMNHGVG